MPTLIRTLGIATSAQAFFLISGGNDSLLQKVQIMRGKTTSETTFERRDR